MEKYTIMLDNLIALCKRDDCTIVKADFKYELATICVNGKNINYTLDWDRLNKKWIYI